MATKNDVTGDLLQSKATSEQYRSNYDLIFRKSSTLDNAVRRTEGKDDGSGTKDRREGKGNA
jgi:hypothetical protein